MNEPHNKLTDTMINNLRVPALAFTACVNAMQEHIDIIYAKYGTSLVNTLIDNLSNYRLFNFAEGGSYTTNECIDTIGGYIDECYQNGTQISLPFSDCFFNYTNEKFYNVNKEGTVEAFVNGIFIHEINPDTLLVCAIDYILGMSDNYQTRGMLIDTVDLTVKPIKNDETGEYIVSYAQYSCYDVLRRLHNLSRDKYFVDDINFSITSRFKHKGVLSKHKIKQNHVIYIGNKHSINKLNASRIVEKQIHRHSMAYEVMGHWRRLAHENWIGHDRQGNEIENGYTWIKPHVRGEGEIASKVRIIKE